ncbi:Gfo/Idh/MocA family protein [Micromonospora sp. CA-263727]|uniref:Gfo/Idh/MocA family protein n=1 Tax=Micromonospora sp. CA-263727 TaxID=3239967 RepID=UPI003D93286B
MINIAVIGYGRVGTAHTAHHATLPSVRITAIVDTSAARRRAAAARHPEAQHVAYLGQVTTPIDLVLICTPPTSHEPLIDAALRRGAHVFCEKPVFLNPDHGRRLVALAAARQRIIYPGHNYLFSPMLKQLRTYATSGAIGPVRHIIIQIDRTGPARGADDWHPTWRTDITHSAGGILTDHGPHCIYLTEWLSGQRIISASATTDTEPGDVDHHAELNLSLTAGVTATATLSWQANARRSTYLLVGSTGQARMENNRLFPPAGPPITGYHETPTTTHAHDDWIPTLAHDLTTSLTKPERLHNLTEPAITIAHILAHHAIDSPAPDPTPPATATRHPPSSSPSQ